MALIVVPLGSETDMGSKLGVRIIPIASDCRTKKFVDPESQHTNLVEGGAREERA